MDEDFDQRLQAVRERQDHRSGALRRAEAPPQGALGMAYRISVELVVAIGLSTGGGWLLDRWLGTSPWAMIVLFFLGAGAGFRNLARDAHLLCPPSSASSATSPAPASPTPPAAPISSSSASFPSGEVLSGKGKKNDDRIKGHGL